MLFVCQCLQLFLKLFIYFFVLNLFTLDILHHFKKVFFRLLYHLNSLCLFRQLHLQFRLALAYILMHL
jgi:hypothetical protein